MAHLGHSLIGDTTYGRRKKISNKALNEDGFNSVNKFHRQACLFHVSERYSAGNRPAAMAAFSTHWCCRTDGLKILLG